MVSESSREREHGKNGCMCINRGGIIKEKIFFFLNSLKMYLSIKGSRCAWSNCSLSIGPQSFGKQILNFNIDSEMK